MRAVIRRRTAAITSASSCPGPPRDMLQRMLRQLRTSSEVAALLDRSTRMAEGVDDAVTAIVADVRARRDAAVAEYTRRFDKREPVAGSYEVSAERWDA